MSQTAKPATSAPPTGGTRLDERLNDVTVALTVVVGTKRVTLRELASWRGESLVTLDQNADDPIEIHAGGTCIATAELCEGPGGDGSLALRILDIGDRAS